MILVVAIALAYANSVSAPFVFDDDRAVVNNLTIRDLWSWQILNPPADGSTTTGRPLLNLSFAINYAISGADVRGYHVTNILLHALAALALFGVARHALRSPVIMANVGNNAVEPMRMVAPFLITLIWAVHPLQTESVTCIAQRSEVLSSLLYLVTLYAFVRGAGVPPDDAGRPRGVVGVARGGPSGPALPWRWLAVMACALGMAAKEIVVTAPLMVLLYDRTFVAGSFAQAWRTRRSFYVALAASWLVLAALVIHGAGTRGPSAGTGLGVSPWDYLLTQCRALLIYFRASIWPYPLTLDYGTGVVRSIAEVWWQGLAVLSLLALSGWALMRRPGVGFLGAWVFVILAPSSSVVPLVTQTIAEHRMYLPLAAIVALLVVGVMARTPRAAWGLGALAVLCGGLTLARNHDYRDTLVIWEDTVQKFPANPRAHQNLALEYQRRGNSAAADEHFARAVALDPAYVSAHYNWGVTLLARDKLPEATAQLRAAVAGAPEHASAQLALGNALVKAGAAAEALTHYDAALAISPGADAHYNRGVALAMLGRDQEAIDAWTAALRLDPALADAHFQLGSEAERRGQTEIAVQQFSEAIRFAPDHRSARRRLGNLAARAGDFAEAARHFEVLAKADPSDADALASLGNTFLARGDAPTAIAWYERALRVRPGDQRTIENLRLARER